MAASSLLVLRSPASSAPLHPQSPSISRLSRAGGGELLRRSAVTERRSLRLSPCVSGSITMRKHHRLKAGLAGATGRQEPRAWRRALGRGSKGAVGMYHCGQGRSTFSVHEERSKYSCGMIGGVRRYSRRASACHLHDSNWTPSMPSIPPRILSRGSGRLRGVPHSTP